MCNATSTSANPEAALVLFWVIVGITIFSFLFFVVLKHFLVSKTTATWKFFQIRFLSSVFFVSLGCIFFVLTRTLDELNVPCQFSALIVLVPALLLLPPCIRLVIYRHQYLLSFAVAEAVREKPSRGSVVSFLTGAPMQRSMFRIICRPLKSPVASDAQYFRNLRGMHLRLLLLVLSPFCLAFVILASIDASEFTLRRVQVVSFVFSVTPLIFILVLSWRIPDPFYLILEIKVACCLFAPPAVVLFFFKVPVAPIIVMLFALSQTLLVSLFILGSNMSKRIQRRRWTPVMVSFKSLSEEFDYCLQTPELHRALADHLTAEQSVDSLVFYDQIHRWDLAYHDNGAKTTFVRAKKIVQCYVGDEALFPVNLPGEVIDKLLEGVGLKPKVVPTLKQKSFRRKKTEFLPPAHTTALSTRPTAFSTNETVQPQPSPDASSTQQRIGDLEPKNLTRRMTDLVLPRVRFISEAQIHEEVNSVDFDVEGFSKQQVKTSPAVSDVSGVLPSEGTPGVSPPPLLSATTTTTTTHGKEVVPADFFREAEVEIKKLMRMDGFNRFRKTKIYHDLLVAIDKKRETPNSVVRTMMSNPLSFIRQSGTDQ